MAEAGTAYVTIVPVSRGASRAIEDQLGGESAGRTVGGQVGDGLISTLGKVLKGGAVLAGGAAVAGIGTIIAKGFARLDSLDQATAKLTGLGHSAEGVQTIMDNALASVKGTAFGLGDAATVAASLVAAGVGPGEDLTRTLSLVGDAATIAGVGMTDMGSIFGKVAASNKAQMDTFNQLADMGVPALALVAQQLGVTQEEAAKMASAGQIDFATFQAAMESGLGGAALSSGDTFQGALANMGAAAGRLGEDLIGGFFPQLGTGFGDLTGWLDSLGPKAEEMGKTFGAFAADALPKVISGIQTFGDIIVNVATWIGQNITLIRNLGIAAGIAVAAVLGFRAVLAVMQAYQAVILIVSAAQAGYAAAQLSTTAATLGVTASTTAQKVAMLAGAAASGIATAAQWALNAAMSANPIMLIVLAIAALVAGLIWFFTQTELGKEIWANFTQFIGEAWANITRFFSEAWANISQFFIDAYEGVIKPIIDGIAAVFTWLYQNIILPVITGIMVYIGLWAALFVWLYETILAPIFAGLGLVFTWLYETIIKPVFDGIGVVVAWLAAFISTTFAVIASVWTSAWGGISSFFSGIWEGIVGFVTGYINMVLSIITTVVGVISGVWNTVWSGISSFFAGIWGGIVSAVQSFGGFFKSAFDGIAGFVSNAFAGVVGAVKGPINGIIGIVNGAIDALNSISVTIPDFVPIVGGQTFGLSLPNIPMLAAGGLVSARPGGIIANIGEGRYDEAVVPLSPKVLDVLGGGGTNGQAPQIIQHITTVQDDPRLQARQWGREAQRGLAAR